ncbi:MAG TPA: hypothetical protein VFS47_11380 [Steroidobacteraceae bacterium]|nr:hypothetical protein [Steroidobacteraceae bacterium]
MSFFIKVSSEVDSELRAKPDGFEPSAANVPRPSDRYVKVM